MTLNVASDLASLSALHFDKAVWEASHRPFFGDPDPYERTRLHARFGIATLDAALRLWKAESA